MKTEPNYNGQNKFSYGQSNQIIAKNYSDEQGNPSGGYVHGVGLSVIFQDGPRGTALREPNGAFVEDLLVAAWQRLQYFQNSKFAHEDNAAAMEYILKAIESLDRRARERLRRQVLGTNNV